MALLAPFHDRARATARGLCRSNVDGDDLFQEAALRALDRLHELRDPRVFRSWFFAVLLSVHRARHRRSFWRRFLPLGDGPGEEPTHPPEAEARDGAERMSRALAELSPEAREAIVLFELEGFTIEEIAELQGASISNVKSRLSRARERLRRHYEKSDALPRASLATERTP